MEGHMSDIYKVRDSGNVFEIQNWDLRRGNKDAFIGRLLSAKDRWTYHRMKEKGSRDTEIWRALHPKWPRPEQKAPAPVPKKAIGLPVEELTKDQALRLIGKSLNANMKSMKRMSVEDLRVLVSRLLNSDSVELLSDS
jgi:hypothetical protein